MIAVPVLLLSLAAGVYLLIQVKHYGFGGLYKALAWLVIILSLACMGAGVVHRVMHHRQQGHCAMWGHCDMKDGQTGTMGHCSMSSTGCTDMPCCAKSHCAPGSSEGCCGKDAGEKKCDAGKGTDKPACCHKGAEATADSAAHK